jgi:hypothetical protein
MAICIRRLSIKVLSVTGRIYNTLSTMSLCIRTLSIKGISVTFWINNTQHNGTMHNDTQYKVPNCDTKHKWATIITFQHKRLMLHFLFFDKVNYAQYCYAECHCTDCRYSWPSRCLIGGMSFCPQAFCIQPFCLHLRVNFRNIFAAKVEQLLSRLIMTLFKATSFSKIVPKYGTER